MSERLSLKERISYGCGDFGLCLITTMVSTYMMYFYTNIVGIAVLQVGTITLIGGIVDAVSDLLMGMLIDKTRTKLGKCRPYIAAMAVPLAVFAFLAFNVPNASAGVKYIYALVTYLLYTCSYTAVCIPYQTLMSSITDRQDDRLSVNMWKTIGSSTGQFIISAFALSIVAVFGGEQGGYKYTVAVFGVAGAILLLTCFKNIKERVAPPVNEKVGIKDTLQSFRNLPWFLVCCTAFLALTAVVLRAQQTMYFAQYVMGDLNIASKLLTISTIVAIPVALVVPKLALKFGKRNLIIFGGIVYILASMGMYLTRTYAIIVVLMMFYRLDKEYPAIREELEARRAKQLKQA